MNRYNWNGIKYPSGKNDYVKFGKNNLNFAVNVLYVNKWKYFQLIFQITTYQVIINCKLSFIFNRDGWHYFSVTKLFALLLGVTSKHNSDFYCLSCLHFLKKNNKPKSHKKYLKRRMFAELENYPNR